MANSHKRRRWRIRAGMVLVALSALVTLVGLLAQLVPDAMPVFGRLARVADSLRLHLFLLAIPLALGAVALRPRRAGLSALLAALLGLGLLAGDYARRASPAGEERDLSILWFNVLGTNDIPLGQLARAIRADSPDLVVLTEALPAVGLHDQLSTRYPYSFGCEMRRDCSILILSKLPLDEAQIADLSSYHPNRRASFTVTHPAAEISVQVLHMIKPWLFRYTAQEEAVVDEVLERRPPDILMGDFNSAPWSRRMLALEREHDLRHARLPVATWPVPAGPLGIPIDHVLVGEGYAITSLEEWGEGLGSNHLGLIAGIDILPQD
ncbi:endonuclease/exonuclease/phosphatase family protein [Pseudoroseicyclus tamaricis]|uniref:Endonuclease/exonuclease/phosphatase family protein n=1 Tax=Pseudoroseicyclus tamaricis TaxID=2705421 RepID=A0A6B2JX87_9RHOB|nr:endonuclease/exonuclease/phosphatase family protein [Pseudoroseicyclus tamaricis]NDV02750.1 endonuclease/exonuclease/phosphatase family protein [Pseudoroseicyclus tamaricis]